MDTKVIFGVIAALLALLSSGLYILDIFKGNTKPHVYTWLLWAIVTPIAFFGQMVSGGGPGSWATGVAALAAIITLALSLKDKYGTKSITRFDKICLVVAVLSIFPWLLTKNVLWSVLLATFIDVVAFFPTIRKTWHAPYSESLGAVYINVAKGGLSTFSMGTYSLITLVYPVSILATKLVIICEMLYLRSFKRK